MRRSLLLLMLAPALAGAQNVSSPITRSLYLALGSDPLAANAPENLPLAASAGFEQSRSGSRWSLRFGADYMRRRSSYLDMRWEEFGINVSARYGRRTGTLRPYLLGGAGIAQLRTRTTAIDYYSRGPIHFVSPLPSPETFSTTRWNGSILGGFGLDARLGRYTLFAEPRFTIYPATLSDRKRYRSLQWTEALFVGVRF
jgi:hypothetical protein